MLCRWRSREYLAMADGNAEPEGDWLLQGQERYLKGQTLRWKRWWSYRDGWDHDHCEFCWRDICDEGQPEADLFGWVTEDDYHWICANCCEEFMEQFEWKLVDEGAGT
jgi:hypothetical protein